MMEIAALTAEDHDAFTVMVRIYLTEIAPDLPTITADRIATAWEDPAREVLLIREGGATKGFALLRHLPDGAWEVSEFYVIPKARRAGFGTSAARAVLQRHPGRWQLGFAQAAPAARSFWEHVLAPLTRAHRGPPLTPHQSGSLHFTIEEPTP